MFTVLRQKALLFSNHKLGLMNVVLVLIVVSAFLYRLPLLGQEGSDYKTYQSAVSSYLSGGNPYYETLASYKLKYGDHGYAYLPGLLNIFALLALLGAPLQIPNALLWQLPLLVADVFIGIFIFKHISKSSLAMASFGSLLWFFNPYVLLKGNTYTHTEPIALALLLGSLAWVYKKPVTSGFVYAVGILVKTLPILMLPVLLTLPTVGKKLRFVVGCVLAVFVFCLPFMASLSDFRTMLAGSLFVHGSRGVQGRPLLYFISYTFGIEAFQLVSFQIYSYLSIFTGWLVFLIARYFGKVKNLYMVAFFCFGAFTILTPVFNRSYSLWVLPFLILGFADKFKEKNRWAYYLALFTYIVFFVFYFRAWEYGFHQDRPGAIINI